MDILFPIGLGFVINVVVFIISRILKQNNSRSFLICFIAFLAVLLTSFIIGSWLGMGIGVISLGMLIFVIMIGIMHFFFTK
ncbi:YesK-like protein [Oceanobacillus limi]|uniref:YesK-like protein n=1 Tax=Oceanobacillus limi TaxID=930131 RepID=A0A1H9ZBL5_9BACI|nr:YesK-like protein [Oceanobacillus limi]